MLMFADTWRNLYSSYYPPPFYLTPLCIALDSQSSPLKAPYATDLEASPDHVCHLITDESNPPFEQRLDHPYFPCDKSN